MRINKIKIILFLIILVITSIAVGQSRNELERRRAKAMEDIKLTNQLLHQTKESQRESYNNLLLINNKINTRRELIQHIKEEIKQVDERITETEGIIESLEQDLTVLKDEYAKMVRIAWKNYNTSNNLMFLFSSESFNQSFLRFKHMQKLAAYRQRQFKAIDYVKHVLAVNIEKLAEIKEIKRELLEEEEGEAKQLQSEQVEQQSAIKKLQKEEDQLRRKLKEQQKQAEQLKNEIEKLIAAETKRTSGVSGDYSLTPEEQLISTNFGKNLGRLPWPVEKGAIIGHYGKQKHPVLRNIEIDNKGIDIATTEGATARAVFDGEVRHIVNLPGQHNAIIIRHGEYLSIYTNIESVFVNVGEKVNTRQQIGKIHTDKSENKTVIHLEIWKGNTTLNPVLWLSK
jgi:murein hydrolase activator